MGMGDTNIEQVAWIVFGAVADLVKIQFKLSKAQGVIEQANRVAHKMQSRRVKTCDIERTNGKSERKSVAGGSNG